MCSGYPNQFERRHAQHVEEIIGSEGSAESGYEVGFWGVGGNTTVKDHG